MLSYGSVCSGVEAATLAWESMGWRAFWFAEIEKFPAAVLAERWPSVSNQGDMTKLPARILAGEIPAPDLLVGGTPCQAFSIMGLRKGLSDPRGLLSLTFVELANAIDTVRMRAGKPPAIIVWENVPGVLSHPDNAYGNFLAALAGEDDAFLPGERPERGKRNKYWRWRKDALDHVPIWPFAGCVYGPQRRLAWRVLDAQHFGVPQRRKRVFLIASAGNDFDPAKVLFEHKGAQGDSQPRSEAKAQHAPTSLNGAADAGERDLAAFGGGNCSGPIPVSTTLTAHGNRMDFDTETFIVHQHPSLSIRRLMPVEYERLQGMPDNHTLIPWRGKSADLCPDAPRLKAVGNSMAIPVMRWIGQRIGNYIKSNEAMKTSTIKAPKRNKSGTKREPKRLTIATNRAVFKWAGGKFKELDAIAAHMPTGDRLIEPFVGGGSVFLNLDYPRYLCADFNGDLINAYTMIQQRPDQLLMMLRECFTNGNTRDYYESVRLRFNDIKATLTELERAADFIYLNRHCFNGLMRYNLQGRFNVSFGRYKKPYLPESEMAHCLQRSSRTEYLHAPFATTISMAGAGDVVYCDPPYEPQEDSAGFTAYATGRFTMANQTDLVMHLKAAYERGAKVVVTNSNAKKVVELYGDHGFVMHPHRARRCISSKGSTRKYEDDIIATLM